MLTKRETEAEEKKRQPAIFLTYSLVFMGMSLVIFSAFIISGRSFIWNLDGAAQHYPILKKFHMIVWEWFQHPTQMQSLDFTMGLGADVFNTFSYYVLGDPFSYLTLLFPENWLEFGYHFMIVFRLYLVGISFIFYARKFQVSQLSLLAGSISYVFCGYIATVATRHPMFITPLILMPLLFLGIDKVVKRQSPILFIVIVGVSLISNFYFTYVLAILALFYWVLRFITFYRENGQFLSQTVNLLGYSLVSLLLAGVILVPTILMVLSASRLGGEFANGMWMFPAQHYALLSKTLISTSGINQVFWTSGGYSVIILFALPFIYRGWRQYQGLCLSLAVGGVMLLFPMFGAIFNAMSSPSNRWSFALGLPISLVIMFFISRVKEFNRQDLKSSSIVIVIFLLTLNYKVYWAQLLLPVIILGLIYLILRRQVNGKTLVFKQKERNLSKLLVLLVAFNLCFVQMYYYLGDNARYLGERLPIGQIDNRIEQAYEGVEQDLDFNDGARAAVVSNYPEQGKKMNYSMLLGMNQIDSYYTLQSDKTYQLAQAIRIFGSRASIPIANGNERTAFYNALGVKYVLANKTVPSNIPYGYSYNSKLSKGDTVVYETQNNLPFMYTSNRLLSLADFEKLSPLDKERALLNYVITDDVSDNQRTLPFKSNEITIGSSLDDEQKLVFNNKNEVQQVKIKQPHLTIGSEVYLKIKGLNFTPKTKLNGIGAIKEQLKTPKNRMSSQDPSEFQLKVTANGKETKIKGGNRSSLSGGQFTDEYYLNLGYQTQELQELTLQSEQIGSYDMVQIEVLAQPFDKDYDKNIEAIQKKKLKNIDIRNSYVSGDVDSNTSTLIHTLIPYSSGWQVFIDDKKAEVIKINIAFMGVKVPQGHHKVEFKYQTPGLKIGFIMSVMGVLLFILICYYQNKKTRSV